jgi:hypothetical protein
MKRILSTTLAIAIAAAISASAMAQTNASEVQRNVNQQTRIEEGLKSGELNTREAARLEKQESKVNRDEARALKDGKLTAAEKAKLQAEQNKVSQDIYREKHDAQKGNANSASSQRMQADVQRNINQQERIKAGVKSGELTKKETAKLERGQARVEHKEAVAGRDGHVGAREQARIQNAENNQSKKIYEQKHDAQVAK